jgi:type VI secretion system protein ImpG
MSETLFPYYQNELVFIRQLAQEFAKKYPGPAGRLYLQEGTGSSTDPHVERLIEAFALLAGRIQHKLDDEFPELTDSLLSVLYPHYLAPIPSVAIVQFNLDPGATQLPDGFLIPRHSQLHTQAVGDLPCKFRTGYPVTLWPIELTSARFQLPPFPTGLRPPPQTQAVLRLQLECQTEMTFQTLALGIREAPGDAAKKLRFFLSGEAALIASLYELLFNHTIEVVYRPLDVDLNQPPLTLKPEQCLSQVGFEKDEGLLPYPNQSFLGYRLLTEFFAFPSKFLFVDLGGWDQVRQAGYGGKIEVLFYLNRSQANMEHGINAQTFRLGCTPIINLFEQTAEGIPLTQAKFEYRIVPDVTYPRGLEVYSVNSVTSTDPTAVPPTETEYQPFYSFRHGGSPDTEQTFWHISRRQTMADDDRGTEVYLNLVDLSFNPHLPSESVLVVRTTCTNRDLPNQLQHAGEDLAFELEMAAPLAGYGGIRCLRPPSPPLRPPLRRGAHWRLLSHLNLNHLSLTDGKEGRDVLQEILRLYDFSDPESGRQHAAVTRKLIEGIVSVSSRRVVGRTGGPTSSGFARGVEVTIEFDEEKYVGTGAFLFACVLERFLGLYASINSFSQLIGKTVQSEEYFKKWRPRAAELQLL